MRFQPGLNGGARFNGGTVEASNLIETPVQVDHLFGARLLVKSVNVLSDHARERAGPLKLGQCVMSAVGEGFGDPGPPQGRPAPVSAPPRRVADEFIMLYGLTSQPLAAVVSIGRNT